MQHALILAFQAVPAAQPAPAPAPVQAGEQQPSGPTDAPAGPGLIGGLLPLLIFVPLIALLFWQSRSQQKKQEAAISSLKKGDKVITQSGIVGRLAEIDARYAKVEVAPGIKLQILRTSLAGRDTTDAATASSSGKSEPAPPTSQGKE